MGEWYNSQFGADFGGVERKNPLPKGMYWVDVFDKDKEAFQTWLTTNRSTVKIRATQTFKGETNLFSANVPGHDWFKFEVLSPTKWEGPGLPTIITQSAPVESSEDTGTASDVAAKIREESLAGKLEQAVMKPDESSLFSTKNVVIGTAVLAVLVMAYNVPKAIASRGSPSSPGPLDQMKARALEARDQARERYSKLKERFV